MLSEGRPSDVLRTGRPAGALLAAGGLALGLGALALVGRRRNRDSGGPPAKPAPIAGRTRAGVPAQGGMSPNVDAARGLNRACGMLAFSVLFDSALEHYRADFFNKAMYTPLVTASLTLVATLHGAADTRQGSHRIRHAILASAGLVGLVGGGFHIYNVGKREGGFVFQNLFYAAPLGAPYALTLAGLLGAAAEWVRDADPDDPELAGISADRILSAISGLGLLGTVGEAGLLHFRGAFQNPAMLIPVSLPPVAATLLLKAAVEPRSRAASYRLTRAWLASTAVMGIAGVFFHAYGVARMMGGWRNWSQNMVDGPPLPAPPSFTGLALAGMAALRLAEGPGLE
jgi:hypothetical protein